MRFNIRRLFRRKPKLVTQKDDEPTYLFIAYGVTKQQVQAAIDQGEDIKSSPYMKVIRLSDLE